MKKENGRSVLLIDPGFQLRVIGVMLLAATITIILSAFAFNSFFNLMVQEGLKVGLPPGHYYFGLIEKYKETLVWIFLATSALVTVFLSTLGLILSHKIAGPVYRLKKYLEDYDSSQGRKLNFRKGDFFPELAEAVNKFININIGGK